RAAVPRPDGYDSLEAVVDHGAERVHYKVVQVTAGGDLGGVDFAPEGDSGAGADREQTGLGGRPWDPKDGRFEGTSHESSGGGGVLRGRSGVGDDAILLFGSQQIADSEGYRTGR